MPAQVFKEVASGTFSKQGIGRRVLTTLGIVLGSLVTIQGLSPDTTWLEFPSLLTPLVGVGVAIQIVSGMLSQAPKGK